ncbi:MAG: threonine/serine exporter family protein [Lachnospiraceae bacterium]|nr:threonine/serine exporter family protein [Lachnospiraceae bacterium]
MEKETLHQNDQELLEVAVMAGHILLENGAEIARVEETMERICRYFGAQSENFFVLSNGIFVTGNGNFEGQRGQYAKVQHIPVKGAQLDKVVAVNQLSREVEEGCYSLEETKEKLEQIKRMPEKSFPVQILASGIGSACFCYLLGGSLTDSAVAFAAGFLLYVFVLSVKKSDMTKITKNICGGALVTLFCILCHRLGLGESLSNMIIGSIIPLVPGVAFTNGIRDIADGDYISGAVRILDAILVFLCVAIGVGVMFLIYHRVFGGVLL